jgi:3-phenylpropionate/trans-cinnamate dioxygenase ferredoxin reductase component
MTDRIICIGAGQAALSCAAKLRALGSTAPITLVGDEPHLPYQRPPLSKKYLTGEMERDRLLLRPPEWYAEQNVECRTSAKVAAIDRAAKTVTLSTGELLSYSALVLATGSTPRRLPQSVTHNLKGLHVVRGIADIDALAAEFKPGARCLVVGGGYIGLEAASVAAKQGLEVTIIEAMNRILERVACKETADYFVKLHESHGVEILTGAKLQDLEGSNCRVSGAVLADGRRMACEVVIVGIGIVPETALAEAAGLVIDNGIKVDEFCRTSDPSIYAVGDCANFPEHGGRLRLESVPNAIAMGENAAAAIFGSPIAYVAKPWFWSDQYDVKLQIAGLNAGYDSVVTRGPGPQGDYSVWYYREGRLIAVDAMNAAAHYMVGKRLIEGGQSVAPEKVGDLTQDMKGWLAR